jgi:hypothetical protein
MSNNHMDFDARERERRGKNTCTVFGRIYTGLPNIPFTMGLDLAALLRNDGTLDEKEQQDIIVRIIDFVFGKGTFAAWEQRNDFTSELCGDLLLYIKFGYNKALLEATEKNAEMLAEAVLTTASTGEPSALISGDATTSELVHTV